LRDSSKSSNDSIVARTAAVPEEQAASLSLAVEVEHAFVGALESSCREPGRDKLLDLSVNGARDRKAVIEAAHSGPPRIVPACLIGSNWEDSIRERRWPPSAPRVSTLG
jgi:hypothetical protein